MAIIKCKMCGGDLDLTEGQSVAECEYCGSRQTVPSADNEKKLMLFARANRLRAAGEFDKAAGIYESIVADFPEEAESYWGLVLCKYGIEYVTDPASEKKVPTCHRSSFDSVLKDSNFELAQEYADVVARKVCREEAKQIEEIRKGILEVSAKEDPYDIFICYKETAFDGKRTLDSVLAQDLYDALTNKGYRVFFARITLEDKLGQEYEPYIFAALNSAKIMLVVGTEFEYFNAVWVKNEWSRYLKLMAKDKSKHLIPCYKGLDAYDMPEEFARLQAQDLGKMGATQDILRGVEKLLPNHSIPAVKSALTSQSRTTPASSSDSLVFRGMLALEDKEWNRADQFFEQALNHNPKNGNAYLGKLLADLHLQRKTQLSSGKIAFPYNKNYARILQFGDASLIDELKQYQEIFNTKNQENLEQAMENIRNYVQDAHVKDKLETCQIAVQQAEESFLKAEKETKTFATLLSGQKDTEEKIIEEENNCRKLKIEVDEKQAECKKLEAEIHNIQKQKTEIVGAISKLGWFSGNKKKEYQRQLEELNCTDFEKKLKTTRAEMNSYSNQWLMADSRLKELKRLASSYQKWNMDMESAQKRFEEAKSAQKEATEAQRLAEGELSGRNISTQDAVKSYLTLLLAEQIPEFDEKLCSYLPTHLRISGESVHSIRLPEIKACCAEAGGLLHVSQNNDLICIFPQNNHNASAFFNTIHAIITGDLEKDKEYFLKVFRVLPIGAFLGTPMGTIEGFLHISRLASYRVVRVEDVLSLGDWIRAKYMGEDQKGRKEWSRKEITSE